jgi:hypothetical protein
MACFAQLDENNIVINVIVVDDKELLDSDGNPQESIGIAFCQKILGESNKWVQTSNTGAFRKNYARVGEMYDVARDAFRDITPPFPSWVLNETTCMWEAPIPYPTDARLYQWDETNKTWKDTTPPSPFPSWTFNNGKWNPSIPYPTDGKKYRWDEKTLSWAPIVPILDGKPPEVI